VISTLQMRVRLLPGVIEYEKNLMGCDNGSTGVESLLFLRYRKAGGTYCYQALENLSRRSKMNSGDMVKCTAPGTPYNQSIGEVVFLVTGETVVEFIGPVWVVCPNTSLRKIARKGQEWE
jgi:hypothetical protein